MFDNSSLPSERNHNDLSLNHLRDNLSSLTHRVGEIESILSRKVSPNRNRWIDLNV